MTNLTIHLDDKVKEKLKEFTRERGMSMKIACERAIVRYINEIQARENSKAEEQ